MERTVIRQRVLIASGVVVGVVVLAMVAVAVLSPQVARRAGETDPAHGLAPETSMDWLSVFPYVAALSLCVWMLVRTRHQVHRRPLWGLLAFAIAWALWRELPWDERILNDANTFSWAKYLGSPDVAVWAQVVLGGGSMLVTVLLAVYVARHIRDVGRLLAEKVRSVSGWVFALGVVLVAVAQVFDKYDTFDRHFGTDLAAWKATGWLGYAEESLELVGPLLLLVACLLATLEEPGRSTVTRGERSAEPPGRQGPGAGGGGASASSGP